MRSSRVFRGIGPSPESGPCMSSKDNNEVIINFRSEEGRDTLPRNQFAFGRHAAIGAYKYSMLLFLQLGWERGHFVSCEIGRCFAAIKCANATWKIKWLVIGHTPNCKAHSHRFVHHRAPITELLYKPFLLFMSVVSQSATNNIHVPG